MHSVLRDLKDSFTREHALTDAPCADIPAFLRHHGCPGTAAHVADVAAEARRLAIKFDVDADQAEIAGWLHDVSAVFPNTQRLAAARALEIDVLPEEVTFPMILHQKISAVMGRELFGIHDEAVLSAAGCHTTLKANASRLDKLVFVADKIAWDQTGTPPYIDTVRAGLRNGLDAAALAYLRYLWERRDQLKVLHPWTVTAYEALSSG